MASETQNVKGYLHRLLADGAKPFRYRGRVRSLLGLPELSGVEVQFSKRLPSAGFSYVVPRFSGEFEFPDEFLGSNRRSASQTEEIFLGVQAESEPAAPMRRTSEADVSKPVRGPLPQTPENGTLIPNRQSEPIRNPQVKLEIQGELSGKPATTSELLQQAGVRQAAPPPQAHEIVLPGGHSLLNSVRGFQTSSPEAIPSAAPGRATKSSDPIRPTPSPQFTGKSHIPHNDVPEPGLTPPKPPEGVVRPVNTVPGNASRRSQLPTLSRSFGKPEANAAGTERGDFMRAPEGAQSPLPRARSVQPNAGPAATEVARSLPALRRFDSQPAVKPAPSFEESREAQAEAASFHAPPAPQATAPIVVVQSAPGPGTASPAFWERRHLSHVKVRIRR